MMLMKTIPYHPSTHHLALKLHAASQIHHNLPTLSPATLLTRLPPHLEPFPAHLRHHVLTIPSFPSLDHIQPLPFHPAHQHILLVHFFHHHAFKRLVPDLHFLTLVLRVHRLTTRMHPVRAPGNHFLPVTIALRGQHAPLLHGNSIGDVPIPGAALPTLADHVNIDADHL